MTDAVVTAALAAQDFAAGTQAGPIVFELLAADGSVVANQSVAAGAADASAVATFTGVGPGTYTVRISRQDASGTLIGSPVTTAPFTVTGASVTITVPVSGSVSVQ